MDDESKKSEEFVTSYFNWLTPKEQKAKAKELEKMTSLNEKIKRNK